jgi:hypothetical protein
MKPIVLVLLIVVALYAAHRLQYAILLRSEAARHSGEMVSIGSTRISYQDAFLSRVISKQGDAIDRALVPLDLSTLWQILYGLLGLVGGLTYWAYVAIGGQRDMVALETTWDRILLRTVVASIMGFVAYLIVLAPGSIALVTLEGTNLKVPPHSQFQALPLLAGLFISPFIGNLRTFLDATMGLMTPKGRKKPATKR